MAITKIISSKPVNKLIHLPECAIESRASITQAHTELVDINTAKDWAAFLSSLKSNECIAFGEYDGTKPFKRTRNHLQKVHNPWVAFDGDYIINAYIYDANKEEEKRVQYTLSIDLLASLDPQLKYVRYVQRPSSSAICHPHKKKIWVQFKSSNWEEILNYSQNLFKRAIIEGIGEYILSESDSSYNVYLRSVFDAAVFYPERIWFEASPTIVEGTSTIVEGTPPSLPETIIHEGDMVDPTALPPLSEFEYSMYVQKSEEMRERIRPIQEKKKRYVLENYPKLRKLYEQAEQGLITSSIITNDNERIPTHEIVNSILNNEFKSFTLRDPLDPDYGADKAKIFYNKENNSIYIHSFAHGSYTYRLGVSILDLPKLIKPAASPSPDEIMEFYAKLKEILRFIYAPTEADIEFVHERYRRYMKKTTFKTMVKEYSINLASIQIQRMALHQKYFLFMEKDAPIAFFDSKVGIKFFTRYGFHAYLENKVPKVSGKTIADYWLQDPKREDIVNAGLYYHDRTPPRHISLYMGHAAKRLPQTVSLMQIRPFIYHIKLFTENKTQIRWILHWLADLVQDPLRKGQRSAISIWGKQRTGKSRFTDMVKSFFHSVNTGDSTRADRVTGRFNSHLAMKVIYSLSEIALPYDAQQELRDIIKGLITDSTMSIEYKQGATLDVPNHLHFIHTTNHRRANLFSADDRRWSLFHMSDKHQNDFDFWSRYSHWWDTIGRDLTFTYLMRLDYDANFIMQAVPSEAMVEAKLDSLTVLDKWILFILASMKEDQVIRVKPTELYNNYVNYAEEKVKHPLGRTTFANELKARGVFNKYANDRVIDVKKDREDFASYIGISIPWDSIEIEEVDIIKSGEEVRL